MFQIEVPESKDDIDPSLLTSLQKECKSIVSILEQA